MLSNIEVFISLFANSSSTRIPECFDHINVCFFHNHSLIKFAVNFIIYSVG